MLTDATESVTRNGRRIQSFPIVRLHSQTNLFARSCFIDLLNCKRRMLIITLMRLSIVCPTIPPWGYIGGRQGDFTQF